MRKLLTYIVAFLACGCLAHGQEADAGRFLRGVSGYAQGNYDIAAKLFSDLHAEAPGDDAVSY